MHGNTFIEDVLNSEPQTRAWLRRLYYCSDEYWRLSRAMGRGRPVDRLYARIRRIVMMLDLAYAEMDGPVSEAVQGQIESLMTWHPTLKKGMRLPKPASAHYLSALSRLAKAVFDPRPDWLQKLFVLPENPADWTHGSGFDACFDEINGNLRACLACVEHFSKLALRRLDVENWLWVDLAQDGPMKVMAYRNATLFLAEPRNGTHTQLHVIWRLQDSQFAPVLDAEQLAKLESVCACALPEPQPVREHLHPAGPELLGAWVSEPAFGQIVEIKPVDAHPSMALHISNRSHPETLYFVRVASAYGEFRYQGQFAWRVIATAEQAGKIGQLATAIGKLIREADASGSSTTSGAVGNTRAVILFVKPCGFYLDVERLRALWLSFIFEVQQQRAEVGLSVQPSGFRLNRPAWEPRLRYALYVHVLGMVRLEAASSNQTDIAELAGQLRQAASRATHQPDFWQRGAQRVRERVRQRCRVEDFGWIRINVHATRRRTDNRRLLILEAIATDELSTMLVHYLFDYVTYRYHWGLGSPLRLHGLIEFLRRYARNRDAPQGSKLRVARGNLLSMMDSFSSSCAAMIQQARELEVTRLNIDLLTGEIRQPGFEAYRHTHLADIARALFERGVVQVISQPLYTATLTLIVEECGQEYVEISVWLQDGERLFVRSR